MHGKAQFWAVRAGDVQGDWGELLADNLCNTHIHTHKQTSTFICEIRPFFFPHILHIFQMSSGYLALPQQHSKLSGLTYLCSALTRSWSSQ